jgi:hypothetical protein
MFGRGLAFAALALAALALAGCSTSIADLPVSGNATDASAPHEPGSYLPVHDLPPNRDEAVISPEERAKIQAELVKARDHQATANAAPAAVPATAAKDAGPHKPSHRPKPPSESHAED